MSDLDTLAREMKAAQDAVRQIPPFTARASAFDIAAAYEVSLRVHRARLSEGAVPVGRKIGFTNARMLAKYGVRDPIWGYMYETTVVQLQGTDTTCSLGRFTEPLIEPEIVLHFRSVPARGADARQVLDAVDWVAHGFEIVQSHFPGWKFQAPDTIADNGLHAALMVGPPQPVSGLGSDPVAALAAFSVGLSCDGRHVDSGVGSNALGSPLIAIAHLVSVLGRQPDEVSLRAGEIVTTGTLTDAHPVRPGQAWRSEIEGIALPGLSVRFVP